jgi:hypothetical protein
MRAATPRLLCRASASSSTVSRHLRCSTLRRVASAVSRYDTTPFLHLQIRGRVGEQLFARFT